jgi:hypothetical protein
MALYEAAMSLWPPCGWHGFALPNPVTVTVSVWRVNVRLPACVSKHKMHGHIDRTNSLCRRSSNLRCALFDPAGAPLTSLVAHLHSRQPERSTQVRDTNCCTRHVSTAVASFAQSVSPADPPVRIQFRTSLTWLPQPWHGVFLTLAGS